MSGGKIANTMPAEPTTGATDAQIEAAVRRRWPEHLAPIRPNPADEPTTRARFAHSARYLVPPDHRIIGPNEIAAIIEVCVQAQDYLDLHGGDELTSVEYGHLSDALAVLRRNTAFVGDPS